MSDLKVGDWTVIDGQVMEVTGFHGAVPVVRPLPRSNEMATTVQVQWLPEAFAPTMTSGHLAAAPLPPLPAGPPILADPGKAERVEQIRAAMRLARANPGREVVFDLPLDDIRTGLPPDYRPEGE